MTQRPVTIRAPRPSWQVAIATVATTMAIGGGAWAMLDALVVTQAEASDPATGYATKKELTDTVSRESRVRADSDAALSKVLDKLVETVDRIDRNQILIGERLRIRKIDRGDEE